MIKERGIDLVRRYAEPRKSTDEEIEAYYDDDTITKDDIFTVLYERYKDDEEAIEYIKEEEKRKDEMTLKEAKRLFYSVYIYLM